MKKTVIKKKLLIPCIAAACMMYGCSSQPSAPAVSPETVAEGETSTETGQSDASDSSDANAKEDTKDTAADNSTKAGSDISSSKADDKDAGEETSGDDTEKESDEEDNKNKKENDKNAEDETEDKDKTEEDEAGAAFIKTVKEAQPKTFPGCTYGNAFDEFFSSPQWEYFTSTDNQDVVEFTGECMYAGARTKARMQFVVGKDGVTVNTGALYYNGTPQTKKIIDESLIKIFEQYAKAHGIPYTLPAPSQPETAAAGTQPQNTAPGAAANALPPEISTEATSAPNAQIQTTENQNSPQTTSIHSGSTQAALEFAAWTNPNIGSWHSPSTGYYVMPYIDSAGNPSLRFASENTRADSATVYYTDAVSAVTNDTGGLTYQAYLYKASGENPQLVGMVEASWNSVAELKNLSVKMINGSQTMDTSMTADDYAYFGAVN